MIVAYDMRKCVAQEIKEKYFSRGVLCSYDLDQLECFAKTAARISVAPAGTGDADAQSLVVDPNQRQGAKHRPCLALIDSPQSAAHVAA
jgi:hypothetical protein